MVYRPVGAVDDSANAFMVLRYGWWGNKRDVVSCNVSLTEQFMSRLVWGLPCTFQKPLLTWKDFQTANDAPSHTKPSIKTNFNLAVITLSLLTIIQKQ